MTVSTEPGKDGRPLPVANAVLLLGIALGLLADYLLWTGGLTGIGFVIWIALFGLATCWLVRHTGAEWLAQVVAWSIVAFAACMVLLFRTTPVVMLSMWLILMVAAAMVLMQKTGTRLRDSTAVDHLVALIKVPLHATLAAFSLLGKIDIQANISNPRLRSISRGALLATPLLLLFAVLFASADATFSRYVSQLSDVFSPETLRHLAFISAFSWLTTGLLAGVCEDYFFKSKKRKRFLVMGTEDTATLMGLVVVLFLVFVFLQLGYLFGGPQTIEQTTGLTLAEYARRGFYELLLASGLTLGLLIAMSNTGCNQRVFRPLAAILVACVLIILVSAGQRLSLYIGEFGLTIDRLTAVIVMLWLAVSMLLFLATVLRGSERYFAASLTITGVVFVFSLALANPAAVVSRVNVQRAASNGHEVDIGYLLSLGSDAIPTLLSLLGSLLEPTKCLAANQILRQWGPITDNDETHVQDWRTWNVSHLAAQKAVTENRAELLAMAEDCPT